jgi:hypothetical protein
MRRTLHHTLAVALTFAVPGAMLASEAAQLVPPSELHRRLVDESGVRRERIAKLQRFFSSEAARKALATGQIDSQRVSRAVAALDSEELARLSERAGRAEADFAAGALSNLHLTYIVIALATAVLILVIVAA